MRCVRVRRLSMVRVGMDRSARLSIAAGPLNAAPQEGDRCQLRKPSRVIGRPRSQTLTLAFLFRVVRDCDC